MITTMITTMIIRDSSPLMNPAIQELAAFDAKTKCVNVIVENSKGSHFKYVYTAETGLFRIKRALPQGMIFPFKPVEREDIQSAGRGQRPAGGTSRPPRHKAVSPKPDR
jgi:hypothetical protein